MNLFYVLLNYLSWRMCHDPWEECIFYCCWVVFFRCLLGLVVLHCCSHLIFFSWSSAKLFYPFLREVLWSLHHLFLNYLLLHVFRCFVIRWIYIYIIGLILYHYNFLVCICIWYQYGHSSFLVIAWYIFHHFAFILFACLNLSHISCRQHVVWSYF